MTDERRDLDRAIAKALGYTVRPSQGLMRLYDPKGIPVGSLALSAYGAWRYHCPHYSTDGNAMVSLITAMQERGWDAHLLAAASGERFAMFAPRDVDAYDYTAKSTTLPEAVATASLKALKGESDA